MKKGALSSEIIEKMAGMAMMYGRYNPVNKPVVEEDEEEEATKQSIFDNFLYIKRKKFWYMPELLLFYIISLRRN